MGPSGRAGIGNAGRTLRTTETRRMAVDHRIVCSLA